MKTSTPSTYSQDQLAPQQVTFSMHKETSAMFKELMVFYKKKYNIKITKSALIAKLIEEDYAKLNIGSEND